MPDESDYRKSEEFLRAQTTIGDLQGTIDELLSGVQKRWPARPGWAWTISRANQLMQVFLGDPDEGDEDG